MACGLANIHWLIAIHMHWRTISAASWRVAARDKTKSQRDSQKSTPHPPKPRDLSV